MLTTTTVPTIGSPPHCTSNSNGTGTGGDGGSAGNKTSSPSTTTKTEDGNNNHNKNDDTDDVLLAMSLISDLSFWDCQSTSAAANNNNALRSIPEDQQQDQQQSSLIMMRRSSHSADDATTHSGLSLSSSDSSSGGGAGGASAARQHGQQQHGWHGFSLLTAPRVFGRRNNNNNTNNNRTTSGTNSSANPTTTTSSRRSRQQQSGNNNDSTNNNYYYYCSSGSSSSSSSPNSTEQQRQQQRTEWKTAIDAVTGRAYYYDAVTRRTQWEKPDEIRRMERRARKEKRRQDKLFFEEMKQNINSSLTRGELIPGITRGEDKDVVEQGPPQEPIVNITDTTPSSLLLRIRQQPDHHVRLQQEVQQHQQQVHPTQSQQQQQQQQPRIRTISGMNEQLLAELQTDGTTTSHHASALRPVSRSASASHPAGTGANAVAPTSSSSIEGRPPLMPPRVSNKPIVQTTSSSSQDSLNLSPDYGDQKGGGALRGEMLLDGPILENAAGGASVPLASTAASGNSTSTAPAAVTPNTSAGAAPSSTLPPYPSLSHIRRNTGGTIYLRSTMENPDINATIKCVCGVFRAHIVQAAARMKLRSPVSVLSPPKLPPQLLYNNINLEIFRDDYEASQFNLAHSGKAPPPIEDVPVPSLKEIELFYHDFYRRSQMEQDTIIMSLIYVERLIKETCGALTPAPHNWRSILFSCMVLSSKVWDDLSMFNLDFSNVSMASGLSSFSLKRTNQLELAVLNCLSFCVRVPASEYAKYYFLIRTMLLRTGLLEDVPVRNDCQGFERRTRQYQDSKIEMGHNNNNANERRARSVDWSSGGIVQEIEPVLGERLCLEQLVTHH